MRPLKVISFHDGRLGHEKQTRGILEALSRLTPTALAARKVAPATLRSGLVGRLRYAISLWRPAGQKSQAADLLVGTGTATHLPMLMLKRTCGAVAVTCMTPDFPFRRRMDLCFVPRHDRQKPAANIFCTVGPPNNVTYRKTHVHDRGLILVGGIDPKSHHWRTAPLVRRIEQLLGHDPAMTWIISSSPRTPPETIAALAEMASACPGVEFFSSQETPDGWIEAQYAASERVWVTADSVSMVYEALSAGCRVGVLPVDWKRRSNKFRRSLEDLLQKKMITTYQAWHDGDGRMQPGVRLDEASRCAREILRRWWPERLPPST